jgi:Transposase
MRPVKTYDWTPRKQSRVLALWESRRFSVHDISAQLDMPCSTVHDIIKRRTLNSKRKLAWPKVLSARDKHCIDMFIKKSKDTHQSPPDGIIKVLGLSVGHTTVINTFHELGYHRCMVRHRPLLKKLDYKRRLEFARVHKY